MAMASGCIFCQVASGKLPGTFLHQDAKVVVFKDINPQAPVHWLVVPREHVAELTLASDELLLEMLSVTKKTIREQGIINYRLVTNGKGAALIDHLHIHVLGSIDKYRKL